MINNASIIDKQLDYIPILSTVTNLMNITAKLAISTLSQNTIEKSHYLTHLNEKSYARCILLLIPFLGNIVILLNELNDIANDTCVTQNIDSQREMKRYNLSNPSIIFAKSFHNSIETTNNYAYNIDRKRYNSNKKNYPTIHPCELKIKTY